MIEKKNRRKSLKKKKPAINLSNILILIAEVKFNYMRTKNSNSWVHFLKNLKITAGTVSVALSFVILCECCPPHT